MFAWSILMPLMTFSVPLVPEVDFGTLPPANTVPAYHMTVTIGLQGRPPAVLRFTFGRAAGPDDAAALMDTSLSNLPWVVERTGFKFRVYAYGDNRVTGITVESTGPKPKVQLVPGPLSLPKK